MRQEKQLDTLRRGSLVVLKRLLSAVVRHWPELVANLLLVIVGYVTPVATEAGSLQWLAVDLLDLLIVDHRVQLKDVIAQLSPFPDMPQFDHLRRVLDQVTSLSIVIMIDYGVIDGLNTKESIIRSNGSDRDQSRSHSMKRWTISCGWSICWRMMSPSRVCVT